jgi:hypothetical protein
MAAAEEERDGSGADKGPVRFFVNVDLDLESSDDLTPLVTALEPHAYSLERPTGRASFELNEFDDAAGPEPIILEFVRLVTNLPPDARNLWDRASRRILDVGLQSSREPFHETHCLAAETLRAVAAIGAEIAITIYALDPSSPGGEAG